MTKRKISAALKTRYVLLPLLAVIALVFVRCEELDKIQQATGGGQQAVGAGDPIKMSDDWFPAQEVGPPVNTSAWEDGPSIAPDGQTLYLSRGKDRDVEQWVSKKTDAGWSYPRPLAELNMKSFPTGAGHTQDNKVLYFASIRPGGVGLGDIYVTKNQGGRWVDVQNLGGPVNTADMESEPYISPDGQELYFASNRKGGKGDLDIWMARKQGSGWSQPVNLGSPVNSDKQETQPFVTADGRELYFMATNRKGVGGPAIFRSERRGSGWSEPEVVASGFVGEPTLTADGEYLYFVHIIRKGSKLLDAQIMFAQRK